MHTSSDVCPRCDTAVYDEWGDGSLYCECGWASDDSCPECYATGVGWHCDACGWTKYPKIVAERFQRAVVDGGAFLNDAEFEDNDDWSDT